MSVSKPTKRKRPAAGTVTATSELVLESRPRPFRAPIYIGGASVVVLLTLVAIVAVRELAVIEPMLAAEGANAARTVVYELPSGGELHVPIEPRTDVLRFVIHAFGKSDMALTPHAAKLVLELRGARGARTEEVNADLPGLRSRVTPETAEVGVGDPIPVELDVHEIGVGELVVKLAEIAGADGVLVRAYRREQLSESEATLRDTLLDRPKKDELARSAWELGWDDLTPAERAALLRARWRKVGALRGSSTDLRSMTVALLPQSPRNAAPEREEMLGRVALRGDERIAMILRPATRGRLVSDEATTLTAASRDVNGATQESSAAGQIEVGPFADVRSVELGAARDVVVEVRTSNASQTEWLGWTNTWRATSTRPIIVDSSDGDRVVRVSLRMPMARQEAKAASLAVVVELTGGPLDKPTITKFTAERPRSRVDRYGDFDSSEAPSDWAAFFLALPRGSIARIAPTGGAALDVGLSELDESLPPLPMPTRPFDAPPSMVVAETEDAVSVFVPRAPSNAHQFDASARRVVRTARWFAPAPPPPKAPVAIAHAKHTNVDRVQRAARSFDGITLPFAIDADTRRPLFVPIVAAFDAPTTVTVRVETDPAPNRRAPALYERWTLPRTMEVGPREMRATFVIGDDVPPRGKQIIHIVAAAPPAPGRHQLVLLPWMSTRAVGPRWLGGAFEE